MSLSKLSTALENARAAIARKVRELRKERQWSQVELARRLGLSQSRLSEIEKGDGSFTAEQLLLMLEIFNVSIGDFAPAGRRKQHAALQNALARLGAGHLQESTDVLAVEQFESIGNVVREVLITAESPRHITALAPILVHNVGRINFAKLDAQFVEVRLERRFAWLLANTLEAVRHELPSVQTRHWTGLYRRAEVVLSNWLDHLTPTEIAHRSQMETKPFDILDANIRSQKTLEEVRTASSDISRRWGIVSSLQPTDFMAALRATRADT